MSIVQFYEIVQRILVLISMWHYCSTYASIVLSCLSEMQAAAASMLPVPVYH